MDNRDSKDFKDFKPAAEPVVRPRRRAAAAAQAAMGNTPVQPGKEAQAPATPRRSVDRAPLAAPRTVYEPRRVTLRTPSVKPVTFEDAVVGKVFRRNWVFILFSILIGIASGVLLLMLNEKNGLLGTIGAEGMEVVFYCLGWGLGLGWLYGFLITRFYRKLSSVLPVYATLLYMPVLLFILLPLLIKFTLVILGIVGGLLYLTFIGFMLFWMWSYFCGG